MLTCPNLRLLDKNVCSHISDPNTPTETLHTVKTVRVGDGGIIGKHKKIQNINKSSNKNQLTGSKI